MPRRTPIMAIILAPLVLFLLTFLWKQAIVPLYLAVRYSDTVMEWRLDGAQPASRIAAIKDIGSPRAADSRLFDDLVISLRTDESQEVRKTAAAALGGHGSQQPLSDAAIEALGDLVLTEQDDAMLSAAIVAVGQSASHNQYPDDVVRCIAAILGEKHLAWLYSRAAMAIGQLGASQPLPDAVVAIMNSHFVEPQRPGEREYVAHAFVEMARGGSMPATTLDLLAAAFAGESNYRIRRAIVYTLAYAAAGYPRAVTFLTAATDDPHRDVVSAAEHGLRIIENERRYADTDPLSLAMDTSRPTDQRLQALQIIRGRRIDPAAYEQVASLARDRDAEVAVAAIDMFRYMAADADGEFEQRVVIPELSRAMAASDPRLRKAAFGTLSQISRYRTEWLRAADFPARLEAGANDSDPQVRVVVLVLMVREAGGAAARDAVIERGATDPDPYVRANVVSWLGSPKTKTDRRDEFIAKALTDPDRDVRVTADRARQDWETRERIWPVEAWRLLRAGEVGQVGMTVLIAVTVATPALICAIFLIYFMARLLTYLQQRRRRALAVVIVVAVWVAASYGVFMLLFVAGLAGNADAGEIAILAGILWGAIALYAALGWGMHYFVRR